VSLSRRSNLIFLGGRDGGFTKTSDVLGFTLDAPEAMELRPCMKAACIILWRFQEQQTIRQKEFSRPNPHFTDRKLRCRDEKELIINWGLGTEKTPCHGKLLI
jgi:hypothetical protein